jgi:hypothetical protein
VFPELVDFSFCVNIPVLELSYVAEGDGPSFPVFRGKDLLLNNFSLSSWKEEILLPDLKKCRLSSCPDLTEFPQAPELELLYLHSCRLKTLPALPSLQKLIVSETGCPISPFFPNLREVCLHRCALLGDFSAFASAQKFKLSYGRLRKQFNRASRIKNLEIDHCSTDLGLERISGENPNLEEIIEEGRIVRLSYVDAINDFSCCNIYSLELCYAYDLRCLKGITSIHHLIIRNCDCLESTEGLGTVTGSLTLEYCYSLTDIVGLQGIPEVTIRDCLRITALAGLGNHNILRFLSSSQTFQALLSRYQKDHEHSEFFSSIKHLIVRDSSTSLEKELW